MRKCRSCGEEKPLDDFRPGHHQCAACKAEYRRQYRVANRDREVQRERRWYAQNREAKLARMRERFVANREVILERQRAWYDANRAAESERNRRRYWAEPEKRRELSRRWVRDNPGRNVARVTERRTLERSLNLSEADIAYIEVLRRDPCAYCGASAGTVDHLEPLNGGGDGGWENLTAACRACNSSKGTTRLLAFFARAPSVPRARPQPL